VGSSTAVTDGAVHSFSKTKRPPEADRCWTGDQLHAFHQDADRKSSMTFRSGPSMGFVSTFPPTACGIATYTDSLITALRGRGEFASPIGVVRLTDGFSDEAGPPVVFHHQPGDQASLRQATSILNEYDTVSIQHEFGIFGGRDGREVLDLLAGIEIPTAVTVHTVLVRPTPHQRSIMDGICDAVDQIVVMSETAASRLVESYGVEPNRISVIAHGADPAFAGPSLVTGSRPLVLTWGLIGPGKGLEWAIEAFADLVDMDPLPRYVIAGATHPQVKRESGEAYRESLMRLTHDLGLEDVVEFDDRYLSREELARLARSADVVVLPYESVEQVTSGVLVEAIAASKPVVATPFPHAIEVLSGGAGSVVSFGDPHRLGAELRTILSDEWARSIMAHRAQAVASDWYWPTVAERFAQMMSAIADRGTAFVPPRPSRHLATR
jgi:polysaccharide biosynthesis protein PslF